VVSIQSKRATWTRFSLQPSTNPGGQSRKPVEALLWTPPGKITSRRRAAAHRHHRRGYSKFLSSQNGARSNCWLSIQSKRATWRRFSLQPSTNPGGQSRKPVEALLWTPPGQITSRGAAAQRIGANVDGSAGAGLEHHTRAPGRARKEVAARTCAAPASLPRTWKGSKV
jgi:hypothetical protein